MEAVLRRGWFPGELDRGAEGYVSLFAVATWAQRSLRRTTSMVTICITSDSSNASREPLGRNPRCALTSNQLACRDKRE